MSNEDNPIKKQVEATSAYLQERQRQQDARQFSLLEVAAHGALGAIAAKFLFGRRGS